MNFLVAFWLCQYLSASTSIEKFVFVAVVFFLIPYGG